MGKQKKQQWVISQRRRFSDGTFSDTTCTYNSKKRALDRIKELIEDDKNFDFMNLEELSFAPRRAFLRAIDDPT